MLSDHKTFNGQQKCQVSDHKTFNGSDPEFPQSVKTYSHNFHQIHTACYFETVRIKTVSKFKVTLPSLLREVWTRTRCKTHNEKRVLIRTRNSWVSSASFNVHTLLQVNLGELKRNKTKETRMITNKPPFQQVTEYLVLAQFGNHLAKYSYLFRNTAEKSKHYLKCKVTSLPCYLKSNFFIIICI